MMNVHRLKLAGAVITLTGAIISASVWGDSSGGRGALQPANGRKDAATELRLGDGLAAGKFAQHPVVAYQTQAGDLLIGAQVKPALEVSAARPRDLLVLVDASASQAGPSYEAARKIVKALSETMSPDDRLSVWVYSTPGATKCLSRDTAGDFHAGNSAKIADVLEKLETTEFPAGAADLKGAIKGAFSTFDLREGRQAAIVLLGDGESAYSPVTNNERYQIALELVAQKVAFFAVPLGTRLNPANLHGFASTTGGTIVRLDTAELPTGFTKRLLETVSAPILYPVKHQLDDGILTAYPTRLPPLRSDSPTLVIGKVKADTTELVLNVEGTVAGKTVKVELREKIAKAEQENFFLASMFQQWSKAPDKAAPALIRADRALAYAMQQSQLTVDEYVTQGHWALSEDRFDVADKLFELALKVDPNNLEATTGKEVVRKLKAGKITRKQLLDEVLASKKRDGLKITKGSDTKTERIDLGTLLAKAEQDAPAVTPGGANPTLPQPTDGPGGSDLLKAAQQQQALAEQQIGNVVDETVRRSKAMLNTDPDGAYELLKRQKASLIDNPEIGAKVKQSLLSKLDNQLRFVDSQGRQIKQRLEEETQRRILAEKTRAASSEATVLQEKTRERIRAFVTLMNQARYEEAYKESLILQQEAITKGQPVPVQATAAYSMALAANNLRELEELRRIREERFLLTMMQVEKSHVPYPDEPPVHFPPASVWRQLSEYRKSRYNTLGLGPDTPDRTKKLISQLGKTVDIEKPFDGELKDILEFLSDRYELTIIIDPVSFKNADPPLENVESQKVKLPKLPGVTLSTVLRLLLSPLGGTYLVRRDYIEITTAKEAIKEKAVRAYEVADLVIPIPNSVNQSGLNQNLSVLGGSFSFGSAGSPFNQFSGVSGLGLQGAFGVGGQGIGIGGGGGGGLGGLGGLGGGANAQGQVGNFVGFGGFGGQGNNLGAGGGLTGFGGGQLGQFGNLGGQFGLQGGDQSALLVQLITDVVARGEWARLASSTQRQLGNQPGMDEPDAADANIVPVAELNSLGYYPPARALVVRATSRIHTRLGGGLLNPRAGGMGMANPFGNRDVLVFGGQKDRKANPANPPAVAKVDPAKEYDKSKPRRVVTPKDWQNALAKEKIKDKAGWVIAITEFLGGVQEFGQAAEVLKANLRQGFVKEQWVFEALAISLEQTKASPAEIERAKLSAIDLDPKDSQAYLRAARAVADNGQLDKAVTFCRMASALRPDLAEPYAEALAFLDKSKSVDSDATAWAVGNLVSREWAVDNDQFQAQAQSSLESIKKKLQVEKRGEEAERLQAGLDTQRRRDLVIELSWQDEADLDLKVVEPIGTVCSAMQRQTPCGSILTSDSLKVRKETYTVTEGFNGSYEVKAERVWGSLAGGKAQVKVTRHLGTPDQFIEYHTIQVDKGESVKVSLTGGRRTALAVVAPPIKAGHPDRERHDSSLERSVNRLRALADPNFTGTQSSSSMKVGGVGTTGTGIDPVYDLSGPRPTAQYTFENRVDPLSGTVDLATKTQVKTNRNGDAEVRVKMTPVFETASKLSDAPMVELPLIPGGK